MFSIQQTQALGLALDKLRPCTFIAAAPLALRADPPTQVLVVDDLRRVQPRRTPLELPARVQNLPENQI